MKNCFIGKITMLIKNGVLNIDENLLIPIKDRTNPSSLKKVYSFQRN